MKNIVYSLALVASLALVGCGSNNDDDKGVQNLGTSSTADRNTTNNSSDNNASATQTTGTTFEFTALRPVDADETKTGRITYDSAVQKCQDFKNTQHPDGGFALPTIAQLEGIDTVGLKAVEGFGFQNALSSNHSSALIVWAQDRKGFILFDGATKDVESTDALGETQFFICIKPVI